MPPRAAEIPSCYRCRHIYKVGEKRGRRCGTYARIVNGVMINGYCHNHQRFAKQEAARAEPGEVAP